MSTFEIEISVHAQYESERSDSENHEYIFSYRITLRNSGRLAAQLIARHWVINHGNGMQEQVNGLGVIGQQPLLQPAQAFEYTSYCHLRTPHGSMSGSFFFVGIDGTRFDVPILEFALNAYDSESAPPRVLH